MEILPVIVISIVVMVSFGKIFSKAGFSPYWGVLVIVPVANLVVLVSLALRNWPALEAMPQSSADEAEKTPLLSEEEAYEMVARELNDNLIKDGLWLKAKVSSKQSELLQTYTKLRVQALVDGAEYMEVDKYKEALSRTSEILDFDPKSEAKKIMSELMNKR